MDEILKHFRDMNEYFSFLHVALVETSENNTTIESMRTLKSRYKGKGDMKRCLVYAALIGMKKETNSL